jgi:hypothetical protein
MMLQESAEKKEARHLLDQSCVMQMRKSKLSPALQLSQKAQWSTKQTAGGVLSFNVSYLYFSQTHEFEILAFSMRLGLNLIIRLSLLSF